MGSKARISKDIIPIIQSYINDNNIDTYIEPFVGGANIIDKIECKNKYGYDSNEYLIAFWEAIQRGWSPLEVEMSRDLYNNIKNNKAKYPQHVVGLAGFCATYNSKWFGGYAGIVKTKIGTERNYYDESVRNILKQKDNIENIIFECASYENIKEKNNCVIYCDPPYESTTSYKDSINYNDYWNWIREMSKNNYVICSEYNAPKDFDCIWSKDLITTLDKNSRSKATEKLFIHNKKETD